MEAFLRALLQDLRSFVPWLLWASVTLSVAIAGPFGSYGAFTLVERTLFWAPVVGFAVAIASVVRAFVYGTLGEHDTLKGTLISAVLNCVILCPPLYLLISWVIPPIYAGTDQITEIVLLVASMSLGICALRHTGTPVQPVEEAQTDHQPMPPRLMRRVEPDLRGAIWAISVRDHYVDVITSRGKFSLLMRFSDAIDEVDCQPGAQVHRSHWVAWDGVALVCREGNKMSLQLKNGHQIPVSRNHRDKVDARFPASPNAKDIAA